MDIYYESLCPDSVRFISQQLKPLYNDFKKHLDISLIPFGKSNVSKKIT
jgi:interferon, gamma-inducible protein 30